MHVITVMVHCVCVKTINVVGILLQKNTRLESLHQVNIKKIVTIN